MPNLPRSLVLALPLLAVACGGDPSTDDRALAALVPENAVAYLRVASIDELTAPARDVMTAAGQDAKQADSARLLAQIGSFAGDTKYIERGRPFAVALSAPKATPPTVLFLVPTSDAAKYAASLTASGLEGVADGSYVVVPLGGKYEKPKATNQLAAKVAAAKPALLSMRVDAAAVATNLGVPIGAALTAAQAAMAKQMAAANTAIDGKAVAETYVNALRTVLASAETLDVRADYRDGQLQFTGSLTAKPGSAMDGFGAAPFDLSKVEGWMTGKKPFEILFVADWAKLWPRFEAMMDALFDLYPPAMRESMRSLMGGYLAVYEKMGPVLAAEGDLFDTKGLAFVAHVMPTDVKALVPLMETMMAKPEIAQLGATLTKVGGSDTDGTTVREYLAKFDFAKLFANMGNGTDKTVATFVEKLFGKDGTPMRFAAKSDHAVMAFGPPREDVAALLATNRGTWSPHARAALRHVGDCNPMAYERIDVAAMMRLMQELVGGAGGRTRTVPADLSASIGVWGGVRDREWRFGAAFDLAGFGKVIHATSPR